MYVGHEFDGYCMRRSVRLVYPIGYKAQIHVRLRLSIIDVLDEDLVFATAEGDGKIRGEHQAKSKSVVGIVD